MKFVNRHGATLPEKAAATRAKGVQAEGISEVRLAASMKAFILA